MSGKPADQGRDFDRSPENLKAILRETFRLEEFRDNQLEAINATFEGKNVFVGGDNGAGKSLCYQLPACLSAGVTVVISPLISLIKDQIQNLTKLGIVARTLSGDCSDADSIYQQLTEEDPIIKLLYVTPEKVTMSPVIKALKSLLHRGLLARFVIDEAQCICQFDSEYSRPDYGTLNELQKDFPGVPMIALSAPVRDCIKVAILKELQMTKPQVFTMSLNQTNLKYAVKTRTTRFGETDCISWINEHYPHDSGIVYCWRRDDCDNMADHLNENGLLARSYHGGMSCEDRENVQNMWRVNNCQVICATSKSFGMGIYKPDVRYVIHTFLPRSVENYYQQSGRAGRDRKLSHCILFYANKDGVVLSRAIRNNEFGDDEPENRELANIGPMVEYCQNTVDCRRQQLLAYLGWGDIEANVCLPNAEAICDNC